LADKASIFKSIIEHLSASTRVSEDDTVWCALLEKQTTQSLSVRFVGEANEYKFKVPVPVTKFVDQFYSAGYNIAKTAMLKFGGNRIRRRTMVASHRLAVVLTQRSSSTTSVAPPPFWSSPFRWYSNKLDTHPILTKCVSSGLVASTGNLLAQRIAYNITNTTTLEEEKEAFVVDWTKVGQFAFLNVTFVGM
jgi:hypothetical protein